MQIKAETQRNKAIELIANDINDELKNPNNGVLYSFGGDILEIAKQVYETLANCPSLAIAGNLINLYMLVSKITLETNSPYKNIKVVDIQKTTNIDFSSSYQHLIQQIKKIIKDTPINIKRLIMHYYLDIFRKSIQSNNEDKLETKPFLFFISNGEIENQPWLSELQETYKSKCDIGLINVSNDVGVLKFFNLSSTPAAILRLEYNKIRRLLNPFSYQDLKQFLDERI